MKRPPQLAASFVSDIKQELNNERGRQLRRPFSQQSPGPTGGSDRRSPEGRPLAGVAPKPLCTLLDISAGTNPRFRRDVSGPGIQIGESVMDGLYLGIAVAGVNALVAMGLVIAFM
jgi:hypothetical protein